MKLQAALLVAFTLALAACGEKVQAAPMPADDAEKAAEPAVTERPGEKQLPDRC